MIIHDVEQNSDAWYALRRGIPTCSEFGRIVTPSTLKPAKTKYAAELAAEVIAGADADTWTGNMLTEHGHENEQRALDWYSAITGLEHRRVGFITNDAHTVGGSPDALVGEHGGAEVKSLLSKNIVEIRAECESLSPGDAPKDYRMQVQGLLWLTGYQWWDLIFHHPVEKMAFIRRVTPDLTIHNAIEEAIPPLLAKRDHMISMFEEAI